MGRLSPNLRKIHPQFQWITPGHRLVKITDQQNFLVSITSLVVWHCFTERSRTEMSLRCSPDFSVARVFKTAFYCVCSLLSRNLGWLESLPHSCPVSVTREVQSCCMPVCRSQKCLRYKLTLRVCLNYRNDPVFAEKRNLKFSSPLTIFVGRNWCWRCPGSVMVPEKASSSFFFLSRFFRHNRILNFVCWMHESYIFDAGHYLVKHGG